MPWYSLSLEVTSYIPPGVHLLRRRKRKRRRTVLSLKYKVNILRRGLFPHLVQRQEDIQAYQGLWDLVIPSNYSRCDKKWQRVTRLPSQRYLSLWGQTSRALGTSPPLPLNSDTVDTSPCPTNNVVTQHLPFSKIQTVEKIGTLHQHIANWPIPRFMNLRSPDLARQIARLWNLSMWNFLCWVTSSDKKCSKKTCKGDNIYFNIQGMTKTKCRTKTNASRKSKKVSAYAFCALKLSWYLDLKVLPNQV